MSDYNDFLLPDPCLRMDTHFGDEYESVEFGDGTGYVKAAPMLARLGALHVELDEMRDENAKLSAENAKLRELLSSYWKRTHLHITSNVERDYLSELRELGVEVDG